MPDQDFMNQAFDSSQFDKHLQSAGKQMEEMKAEVKQLVQKQSDINPAVTIAVQSRPVIAGNAFRRAYRPLEASVAERVDQIKAKAEELYTLLAEAGGTDPSAPTLGSAELTLAFRDLQVFVMRAVNAVTA